MRVSIYHPSGNQFFRKLVAALLAENAIDDIGTCIDWREPVWLGAKLWPKGVRAELERRAFSREFQRSFATWPWQEAGRLLVQKLGWTSWHLSEGSRFSIDRVWPSFDRRMSRRLRPVDHGVVYAYEYCALDCFHRARELGLKTAYDLPIAYWAKGWELMAEERERLPAWGITLQGGDDSAAKKARKEQELAAADLVVCPSQFVIDSLPKEFDRRKVVFAPFGTPAGASPRPETSASRPLRVLFAGSMSQRKGLGDLFAAMNRLNRPDVELVVLGLPLASFEFYRGQCPRFTYEPVRPHAAVLELMRSCDVFCLPSIVEGRALVVQEAMSQGLPAIITPNTGADDVIAQGENGFVVPIRSPEAIAEKIAWFADHRDRIASMGRAAQRAAATVTWQNYTQTILRSLHALAGES